MSDSQITQIKALEETVRQLAQQVAELREMASNTNDMNLRKTLLKAADECETGAQLKRSVAEASQNALDAVNAVRSLFFVGVLFETISATLHDFGDFFTELLLNIVQPRQATFILNCIVQQRRDRHVLGQGEWYMPGLSKHERGDT